MNQYNENDLFNFFENEKKVAEKMMKERESVLKEIFKHKIKPNFLIYMLNKVKNEMGTELGHYFDFSVSIEKTVKWDFVSPDYEICRMIVGVHRSKTLLLEEEPLAKLQNDNQYIGKLTQEVITHIKLRYYAADYFRNKQIIFGEEFLYYPFPYRLFALSLNACFLMSDNRQIINDIKTSYFYITIFNKAITALTLLGDNMFDSVYPICRAIIEIFLKLNILELNPGLINEYNKFVEYDFDRQKNDGKYTREFLDKFENRINRSENIKNNYLFYGWVDALNGYHNIVTKNAYSLEGLSIYLNNVFNQGELYDTLIKYYKKCNSFTHGNVASSLFPLYDYFDITVMLELTIPNTYRMLCNIMECDEKIDGNDILTGLFDEFEDFIKQKDAATPEILEKYYKKHPMQ
ncbi:MAG: hypothetical protein J5656_01125 [Clostridia bacterium]|nr:hypothetical protein [Clostridia bacterium]